MLSFRLRDCLRDFVDRTQEKRIVEEFCDQRRGDTSRCLIFHGRRDVGLTFFLQHIEQVHQRDMFTVYADCHSSDPEIIFSTFFARLEQRPLLRWFSLSPWKELGTFLLRVSGAFLSFIPVFGAPASEIVGGTLPQIAFTPYSSLCSERFSRLVTSERWNKPVLFLIDNVQEIGPQSLNILRTAFSNKYNHVKFVLCFIDEGHSNQPRVEDFEARLVAMGINVDTRAFLPPNEDFVVALENSLSANLTGDERQELLAQSKNKMSLIVMKLLKGTDVKTLVSFSPLETELLRYLYVAAQSLQEADIIALTLRSPRISCYGNEGLTAIRRLADIGILLSTSQFGSKLVMISASAIPQIKELISHPAFDWVAAQEMYRYFVDVQKSNSTRHAPSAYGALLYKLAKLVDSDSLPKRALELVRISLGQGDLNAARQYVQSALEQGSSYSTADLYTMLAFHISVQEYQEALTILESFGSHSKDDRTLQILYAVTQNRLRHHDVSNHKIDRLLDDESTEEEWALLTSYKVAGLLHEGKQLEAALEFESNQRKFLRAHNRGYALRNCAAVYFWDPTKDHILAGRLLLEACEIFVKQSDRFGYLTTLNNQGALIGCDSNNFDPASILGIFQEVYDGLSVYGVHHLEEVGANLGTCLVLNGQLELAANHLRKMSEICSIDFPRVVIESALAFVEAICGSLECARTRMAALNSRVRDIGLSAASYHAIVNAAAIEGLAGDTERFRSLVSDAVSLNYWGGRSELDRVIHGTKNGELNLDTLPSYLSYDFFQYWSQNPLSIFSSASLPQEAKRNYV